MLVNPCFHVKALIDLFLIEFVDILYRKIQHLAFWLQTHMRKLTWLFNE